MRTVFHLTRQVGIHIVDTRRDALILRRNGGVYSGQIQGHNSARLLANAELVETAVS